MAFEIAQRAVDHEILEPIDRRGMSHVRHALSARSYSRVDTAGNDMDRAESQIEVLAKLLSK